MMENNPESGDIEHSRRLEELADQWLAAPNDNPLFNGAAPLDRLLAGQVVDLAVVRDFLDAERGGW